MEDNTPKKFDWSTVQSAEVLEESRAYRFPPEWRPLLMQYLGLAPGMHVLEVGCGPGTLACFLAEAVTPGRVTGVDLDEGFIARAREKAARFRWSLEHPLYDWEAGLSVVVAGQKPRSTVTPQAVR